MHIQVFDFVFKYLKFRMQLQKDETNSWPRHTRTIILAEEKRNAR